MVAVRAGKVEWCGGLARRVVGRRVLVREERVCCVSDIVVVDAGLVLIRVDGSTATRGVSLQKCGMCLTVLKLELNTLSVERG